MTTTELKIVIKADDPEYNRKRADDDIDPLRDHRETAQLAETSHEPHPGYDISNKDTKRENDAIFEDLATLFA